MLERTTTLSPEEVYEELKKILLREKCEIIEEEPPERIVVEQGSWLGYSPRTYQKVINFHLIPHNSGTRVVSETLWKTSTVVSGVLASVSLFIIAGILWWLISDMEAYIEGERSSLSGWFAELFGYTGFREILAWTSMFKTFLIFTFVVGAVFNIILEIYFYLKREIVAERILRLLP